ncbi:hypothetical protein HELRODRAFT_182982 [Helobdella robusta]|uniref:Uncharacterized protein n=1 Tax=Helobdella robusta TaxID=6412 RepID=T1FJ16_HELRO|nr:hypothetical protein HELRODRAFT_182982 [Helobdella robusta]ESN89972.1 hypothetical protein HELRODRAFT_182982 [Helobdella robusta]
MDIHEQPVTCCHYLSDCSSDVIPAIYNAGSKMAQRKRFSERFSVTNISFCDVSKLLAVSGSSYVIVFEFSRKEFCDYCPVIPIHLAYENFDPKLPMSKPPSDEEELQKYPATKFTPVQWQPGYKPLFCCQLLWRSGRRQATVTAISLSSKYGLLVIMMTMKTSKSKCEDCTDSNDTTTTNNNNNNNNNNNDYNVEPSAYSFKEENQQQQQPQQQHQPQQQPQQQHQHQQNPEQPTKWKTRFFEKAKNSIINPLTLIFSNQSEHSKAGTPPLPPLHSNDQQRQRSRFVVRDLADDDSFFRCKVTKFTEYSDYARGCKRLVTDGSFAVVIVGVMIF